MGGHVHRGGQFIQIVGKPKGTNPVFSYCVGKIGFLICHHSKVTKIADEVIILMGEAKMTIATKHALEKIFGTTFDMCPRFFRFPVDFPVQVAVEKQLRGENFSWLKSVRIEI